MTQKGNSTIQALWVSIGNLSAFLFAIVSSMILSRYFVKDDYGTYQQVLYVYNTLLIVFTLGLPGAFTYFLPRVEKNEAKDLIKKITNIFFLLGGVFSILLYVFAPQIALMLKNQDLTNAIRIFSPVPLFMLPTMGLEGILATFEMNRFMALYTIITRTFMLLCVVGPVVFFHAGYQGAITGFVIASFITFLLALYLKFYPVKSQPKEKCSVSVKEIFKYSLPLVFANLWGIVINSSDQFFISRYFGPGVFADFSNGSLQLPFVTMVVAASSTVLAPIFSRQIHEKKDPRTEILPLWLSVFEKSVKILYPLVIFFFVFADIIMVVLYGKIYENSGIFFRIKLVVNFFTLISFAPLILSIGATKYYAKVHMFGALILVLLEYITIITIKSPYAIGVVSVICQIGRIFFMLSFISEFFKIKLSQLFPAQLILKILLPSFLMLFGIRVLLKEVISFNGLQLVIIAFGIYLILYFLWTRIARIDYLSIIKPVFTKFSNRKI